MGDKIIMYDVAVIGGGPAGLNAGLVLSRCRRKVVVIDDGNQRNLRSHGIHGFITRDGIKPDEFLSLGVEELKFYGTEFVKDVVTEANKNEDFFELRLAANENILARKVLISTGIKDNLPPLPGIDQMYGTSVFHCPYCDGWESRDKKIAVYANGKAAYALSSSLKTWSDNVFIVSDGSDRIREKERGILQRNGIQIYSAKIKRLKGINGVLEEIIFMDDSSVPADVLFFSAPQYQRSVLAERLGCKTSSKGFILFDKKQSTNIKGLFVAGDAAHDMKFVIVAAAEGAKAAIAINKELQEEELEKIKNEV
jgi:thioredoxin reductase